MDNVIEIVGLTKKYGTNLAVNNISFSIKSGEVLGFLGPNGAGKSTTMNILTGYLSSDKGKAMVCGYDILENPSEVKSRIGYLPEQPPLYLEMTPNEYLDFICDLKSVKDDRQKHIDGIMKTVGVDKVAGRLIKNLSKGYKQRVGLAGALIGDPEVLILDEPTVGLDPSQIIEIRNLIKELGKKRTIILSTHILQEVSAVCDRVIIINRGEIVAEDTLENLSAGGKSGRYTLRLIVTEDKLRALLPHRENIKKFSITGSREPNTVDVIVEAENGIDIREELFNICKDNDIVILSFKTSEKTLEDVFINAINNTAVPSEGSNKKTEETKIEEIEEIEEKIEKIEESDEEDN